MAFKLSKELMMAFKLSQDEKQFHQLKANFFLCVTEVLQLLVDNLCGTEISKFEEEMAEMYGSKQVVHKWFMSTQHSIIDAGDISKMNMATCFTFLQYDVECNLEPPDSEKWTDRSAYGNSLEYQITSMIRQLIHIAYTKDVFDIIQQNKKWDQLIDTLHGMESILEEDFHITPILKICTVRKEIKGKVDLLEYEAALDFIVKREIFENLRHLEPESLVYFCPIKLFSNFQISHLNTDEHISYTDIFNWKDKDDKFPQIFVICGEQAVGKTMYLKYVYQHLFSDPPMFIQSSFIGFDKFELVIFIESMNNSSYCLVEYINSSLQNTMKKWELHSSEIQDIMIRYKLLIIIDSFEVATPDTHQLLKELSEISTNNITLMIATRSDSLDDLREKLSQTKKTIILYPEANVKASLENECKGQMAKIEGDTTSCNVALEIPPGYETSKVSNVLKDIDHLTKELSNCEILAIKGKIPRDKKKPNAKIIKIAASKLDNLIVCLGTATAQFGNYESNEERCQLQEILNEYEELQEEADALNKKLSIGVRTELFKLGSESIFCGILYWYERLCGELSISQEMLDEMDNNYSKVKNKMYPKSELDNNPVHEKPHYALVINSLNALCAFRRQAMEAVTMIEINGDITDQKTKNILRELVIDIRNLRERCDLFNESIPKVIMYNYIVDKKYFGLFAGLDYFTCLLRNEMEQKNTHFDHDLINQLDEADKEIRKHLLNTDPTQPKLVKSWKSDSCSAYKKKDQVKKTKGKKKGW